jgi:hypothetical protein
MAVMGVDPATGLPVVGPPNPGFGVGLPNTPSPGALMPRLTEGLDPLAVTKGPPVMPPGRYDPLSSAPLPAIPGEPVSSPEMPAEAAPGPVIPGLEAAPAPGGIAGWLAQPENRAALLQASIMLLQPPARGQSIAGQFGQAIGAGAEAKDRSLLSQQEQDRYAAQQLLEERKVAAEEVRAAAATTAAEKSATGITPYQLYQMGRNVDKDWLTYLAKAKERSFEDEDYWADENVLNQTYEQYLRERGMASGGGAAAAGPAVPAGTTLTTAAPATPATTIPAPAIQRLNAHKNDPRYIEGFEKTFGLPPGGHKKYLTGAASG